MAQIKIPSKVSALSDLSFKIIEQSQLNAEESLLSSFENFQTLAAKVTQMNDYEKRADEASRLKEEMNEQKNKLSKEIRNDIVQIRNLLKAHYPNDIKKLGAWGFIVDEVAPKK